MERCIKYLISITTLLFNFHSYSQLLFKISSDTLRVFTYSGGDEFSGNVLDQEYWKSPWNKANLAQNFRYNDENVRLENGTVNFVMLKQDSVYTIQPHEIDSSFLKERKVTVDDYKYLLGYSAGMIITRQKFHYGLYELRFKVEEGKGVWPSFWFYGGNKNEEIDAFELKGERNNEVHVDTHCPSGCDRGYKNKLGINTNWGGWMKISDYLHNGYNILMLEWKAGEILWYINGYPLAYFKGDFPNPMNLFLNTQIAADGRAFKPGPDKNTVFPNNFYIDYIRMWKENPGDNIPFIQVGDLTVSHQHKANYLIKSAKKGGLMYQRKKFNSENGLISVTVSKTGTMIITVLGKINTLPATVLVHGKNATYEVNDFSKENEFILTPEEREMELLIKTGDREFRQKFIVKR